MLSAMLAWPVQGAGEVTPLSGDYGRLAVHSTVQFLWEQSQGDPADDVEAVQRFLTRRVQLGLYGESPGGKAEYLVTVTPVDETMREFGVYEAWINARLAAEWALKTGSFLPPWTFTMPVPVHELRFVRYPLLVDSGRDLFTPWMQTGAMLALGSGENLSICLGVFNGLDAANSMMDRDGRRDVMVSANLRVAPWLRLGLGHWGGETDLETVTLAPGDSVSLPFGLGLVNNGDTTIETTGGIIDHSSVWFGVEIDRANFYLATESVWNRAEREGGRLIESQGFQVSIGYSLGPLTPLVRYEQFDPDTSDQGPGQNDEMEWTTLGLNYQPHPWLKIMADYIFKAERLDNQTANDEFIFQVSVGI